MADDDLVSLRIALSELGISNVSEVVTDVIDAKMLRLSRSTDSTCLLELSFPCLVDEGSIKAKFKSKTGLLIVSAKPIVEQRNSGGNITDTVPLIQSVPCSHEIAECSANPQPPNVSLDSPAGRSDVDDAALFREFADEAYAASVTIQDAHTTRPTLLSSTVSREEDNTGQSPASSSQKSQSLGREGDPAPGAVNQLSASKATSESTATSSHADEEPVALAVGIDGSGLAKALGFSFEGPSAAVSFSSVNAKKSKKLEQKRASAVATTIIQSLAESLMSKGWAACDNFIPAGAITKCREELKQMEQHYTPGQIWVGKEADSGTQIAVQDVRGDSVLWMDEQALTATAYIKDGKKRPCSFQTFHHAICAMDQLIMHELAKYVPDLANLSAGGRSDAMCAVYPGKGTRFAKHIDNSANDGRRLTSLLYMNNAWVPAMGGCLRLFSPGQPPVDVLPLGGRVALFWSKTVAHEVRPTGEPRHSVTLWYYDALEKAEALANSKVSGGGGASAASQAQAKALIRDILAQDVITPTDEGCSILSKRVKAMTTAALSIVAGVVGATSVSDFVAAASHMSPSGLTMLRDEIGRMGLQQTHAPTAI